MTHCCHGYLLPTLTVGKGVDSCDRLCRRISVPSVPRGVVAFCIHGWLNMSSKDGLSEGLRDRHHLISCWHSGEKEEDKRACQW